MTIVNRPDSKTYAEVVDLVAARVRRKSYRQDTEQSPEAMAILRRIRPHWRPSGEDELRQALAEMK